MTINIEQQIETGKWGGDYWNPTQVAFAVRRHEPKAVKASYSLTTGLWADVHVTLADGTRKDIRI